MKFYVFQGDEDGEYETDGHYSTVYLVCLMLGMEESKAMQLAKATEFPDTDIHDRKANLNYTWSDGEEQIRTHALNNGFHTSIESITAFEFINSTDKNIKELGRLLHRYGDTYAHSRTEDFDEYGNPIVLLDSIKMYGKPISTWYEKLAAKIFNAYIEPKIGVKTFEHHVPEKTAPDLIANRPNWYIEYVKNLAMLISLKFNLPKELYDNFNKKEIELFKKLANYAKTNNTSLIGIINFEIGKWLYNKSSKQKTYFEFYIPFARGKYKVEDKDAHTSHILNTVQYLEGKDIKYSKVEYLNKKEEYLGIKFKITNE